MKLENLLSAIQQQKIVEIIQDRCRKFRSLEKRFDELFYQPYTQMRHKPTLTSAIISGFSPNCIDIEGISSEDLPYGLNDKLVQPELRSENGIFHIYSNGSDLKGKKIRDRCNKYNSDLNTLPLFFIVVVSTTKEFELEKVEVCIPNKDCKIVHRYSIYEKLNIIAITA